MAAEIREISSCQQGFAEVPSRNVRKLSGRLAGCDRGASCVCCLFQGDEDDMDFDEPPRSPPKAAPKGLASNLCKHCKKPGHWGKECPVFRAQVEVEKERLRSRGSRDRR